MFIWRGAASRTCGGMAEGCSEAVAFGKLSKYLQEYVRRTSGKELDDLGVDPPANVETELEIEMARYDRVRKAQRALG